MNLEKISNLIKNRDVKEEVMKIIKYEQSQLHKSRPRYKEKYYEIIEEGLDEDN